MTDTFIDFASVNACQDSTYRTAWIYNKGFVCRHQVQSRQQHDKGVEFILETFPDVKHNTLVYVDSFYNDNVYISLQLDGQLIVYTKNEEDLAKFAALLKPLTKSKGDGFSIIYMHLEGQRIQQTFMVLSRSKVEDVYPELYPDIDIEVLAKEFSESYERILLLYGIPGVGKTSFIRYMLCKVIGGKNSIVYVKDSALLTNSAFWTAMSTGNYDYLLLDDLGASLTPRTDNNSASFISELLSFTSGILEQNACRVIITTNQTIDRVDPALVRPGRCFDFLTLSPLTFDYGKELWVDKFEMDALQYDLLYRDKATVTQAELMSDYNRLVNATTMRSYLKGDAKHLSMAEKLKDLENPVGFRHREST